MDEDLSVPGFCVAHETSLTDDETSLTNHKTGITGMVAMPLVSSPSSSSADISSGASSASFHTAENESFTTTCANEISTCDKELATPTCANEISTCDKELATPTFTTTCANEISKCDKELATPTSVEMAPDTHLSLPPTHTLSPTNNTIDSDSVVPCTIDKNSTCKNDSTMQQEMKSRETELVGQVEQMTKQKLAATTGQPCIAVGAVQQDDTMTTEDNAGMDASYREGLEAMETELTQSEKGQDNDARDVEDKMDVELNVLSNPTRKDEQINSLTNDTVTTSASSGNLVNSKCDVDSLLTSTSDQKDMCERTTLSSAVTQEEKESERKNSTPLEQTTDICTLSSVANEVNGSDDQTNVCERTTLSSTVTQEEGRGGKDEVREKTPSVSSSGYGGSREATPYEVGTVAGEGIITDDMMEEEKRLKERESREESLDGEAGELSHMKEYQRYKRLQHLLQKSSIYSKFLLERMENQIEERKKSTIKSKKKPPRVKNNSTQVAPPTTRRSTRGQKRKATEQSIQLSHYMDDRGKLKKMKLDKGRGKTEALDTTTTSTKKQTMEEKKEDKERSVEGVPVPAAQPVLMTGGVMRSYQIEGMEWIKVLYENGVNGILADEMGLGKTLQVIAVIAHLIEMGVKGPFLVAAPLSTLPNWVSEFKKFTPEIPAILYHGTQLEREKLRRKIFKPKKKSNELDTLPVVVTSYEICMRDQRHLMYRNWRFLVVDEGHRIKNLNCKLIKALKSYDAANRLLLTGTPLQNNLAELWSLLNFILPDIFDDLNGFQSWFDFDVNGEDNREKIIAQEREQNVLSTLHQILTPFLLRRLKTDVEFSLPPKKEVLVYAPLTAIQQRYYTSLLDRTIFEMVKNKNGDNGSSSQTDKDREVVDTTVRHRTRTSHKGYAQLNDEQFESLLSGDKSYEELVPTDESARDKQPVTRLSATNIKLTNVWMMLRKCCNHPYLLEFPMTTDGQFRVDEDLVTSCGKLMLLDRLLSALISRGHKTIIFSQFTSMLDILEDYLELRSTRYGRLDGQMAFGERQRQMAAFQGDPDCWVFLTSTRAGGLGINLTAADTVIIYDSDWNPQADLQAQDRCHRIGQTKPVMVYRLVTANTFDQRIVERAASKRRLEKMVIHKGKFKGYSGKEQQLSLEDLTSLLHSVDHQKVVNSNDAIISDKALEVLLDRTFVKPSGDGNGVEMKENESVTNDVREHEAIFKVINEQDTPGNTLLSINNCTTVGTTTVGTTTVATTTEKINPSLTEESLTDIARDTDTESELQKTVTQTTGDQ